MQPSVDLLQVPTPGPCSLTSLVPTQDAMHRLAAARGPPLPNFCTAKMGEGAHGLRNISTRSAQSAHTAMRLRQFWNGCRADTIPAQVLR
jgi:hypothetical protein